VSFSALAKDISAIIAIYPGVMSCSLSEQEAYSLINGHVGQNDDQILFMFKMNPSKWCKLPMSSKYSFRNVMLFLEAIPQGPMNGYAGEHIELSYYGCYFEIGCYLDLIFVFSIFSPEECIEVARAMMRKQISNFVFTTAEYIGIALSRPNDIAHIQMIDKKKKNAKEIYRAYVPYVQHIVHELIEQKRYEELSDFIIDDDGLQEFLPDFDSSFLPDFTLIHDITSDDSTDEDVEPVEDSVIEENIRRYAKIVLRRSNLKGVYGETLYGAEPIPRAKFLRLVSCSPLILNHVLDPDVHMDADVMFAVLEYCRLNPEWRASKKFPFLLWSLQHIKLLHGLERINGDLMFGFY